MEKQPSLWPQMRFGGKTAVVTGSGTGIGQAIAKKFAEHGANVVIMGRRKEPLDETSRILKEIMTSAGSGGRVLAFSGVDVADEGGINEMFEGTRREFGRVDILINNAGVSGPVKAFTNADVKDFRDCVAIHLTGTYWTSVRALESMEKGGRIITISTFFSEENRYEQRPYRFRTPYTAAQGAKNRLAEALAWELVDKDIRSIATNPGPVHSDRIYKTVYPKAAAEFMRIGGYPGLNSVEVELAATNTLPLLGEPPETVKKGIEESAKRLAQARGIKDSKAEVENIAATISGMLNKIQEIAEKIQNNTSKMIVDGEFLTQEDVAEMVMALSDDRISRLINGRVIPNDRVFYSVKPAVGTSVPSGVNGTQPSMKGQVVVLSLGQMAAERDIERAERLASRVKSGGGNLIILVTGRIRASKFKEYEIHDIDLLDERSVRDVFDIVATKFDKINSVIHFTGSYDYDQPLHLLSRAQWDRLIENYVYAPGLITKQAVNALAPEGAVSEPAKFKGSNGHVVIIGPDSPVGKKISGVTRARAEVFRGALRPYVATVNQELGDVLGSKIRVYLILPGSSEGAEPNTERLQKSVVGLISGTYSGNESIFYVDEARPET